MHALVFYTYLLNEVSDSILPLLSRIAYSVKLRIMLT